MAASASTAKLTSRAAPMPSNADPVSRAAQAVAEAGQCQQVQQEDRVAPKTQDRPRRPERQQQSPRRRRPPTPPPARCRKPGEARCSARRPFARAARGRSRAAAPAGRGGPPTQAFTLLMIPGRAAPAAATPPAAAQLQRSGSPPTLPPARGCPPASGRANTYRMYSWQSAVLQPPPRRPTTDRSPRPLAATSRSRTVPASRSIRQRAVTGRCPRGRRCTVRGCRIHRNQPVDDPGERARRVLHASAWAAVPAVPRRSPGRPRSAARRQRRNAAASGGQDARTASWVHRRACRSIGGAEGSRPTPGSRPPTPAPSPARPAPAPGPAPRRPPPAPPSAARIHGPHSCARAAACVRGAPRNTSAHALTKLASASAPAVAEHDRGHARRPAARTSSPARHRTTRDRPATR